VSRPLVFLFPGQSARDPEMFARLAAVDPAGTAAMLSRLRGLGVEPTGELESNCAVQLAVFGATRVWAGVVARAGLRATHSAGHSLGEYGHLVDRGALAPDAALALVAARGAGYDAGPYGAMAAVHPIGADDLTDVLPALGEVWIACDNAPTQVVLGGARAALDRAMARLEEEHFTFSNVIERRIPMHTPRFAPVGPHLRRALERAPWSAFEGTYWSNVLGGPVEAPSAETVVDLLTRHVSEPVRWRQTVDAMLARHPDAVFLEVGPRRVLTDMLRRWKPGVPVFAVDPVGEPADAPARVAAVLEEVGRAA
jgi:[acyl-carrier-protein] S-malonyltransferase